MDRNYGWDEDYDNEWDGSGLDSEGFSTEGDEDDEDDDDDEEHRICEWIDKLKGEFFGVRHGDASCLSRLAEKCLTDVHGHQALIQFFATLESPFDQEELCQTIFDLFNVDVPRLTPWISHERSNSVLVCVIQYCLSCNNPHRKIEILALIERAHIAHLALRSIEHNINKQKLQVLQRTHKYPIRPEIPSCDFYLQHGRCGYGESCRYHHPPERLIGKDLDKKVEHDEVCDQHFENIKRCWSLLRQLSGEKTLDNAPAVVPPKITEQSNFDGQQNIFKLLERSPDEESLFGAELVASKKKKKFSFASDPDDLLLRKDLRKVGIDAERILTPALKTQYYHEVLTVLQDGVRDFLKALSSPRFALLAAKIESCQGTQPASRSAIPKIAPSEPVGPQVKSSNCPCRHCHSGDCVDVFQVTDRRPTGITTFKHSFVLTQATQSYAIAPGRIAYSREHHKAVFSIVGYKLSSAPGIGASEELAEKRALNHLIVLFNKNRLEGQRRSAQGWLDALPQHVRDSLQEALCAEAQRRIRAFLTRCKAVSRGDENPEQQNLEKSMVQRMFDGIGGPWVLNLTEAALADLKELRRSPNRKEAIRRKLQKIEKGEWDSSVACALGSKSAIQIYEAKPLDNVRVLWQVDVGYSHLTDQEGQIIRIWTILSDHKEVERLLPRLAELNNQRSKEHIALARERYYPTKGSLRHVLPKSFSSQGDDPAGVLPDSTAVELSSVTDTCGQQGGAQSTLAPTYSEKFRKIFPISDQMVYDILEGKDVPTQHSISLREARIINAHKSCLVMGRSGTGKTTCCLFRLLAMHRGVSQGGGAVHRQLFVTKSVELLVRVKRFYVQMTTDKTSLADDSAFEAAVRKATEDKEAAAEDLDVSDENILSNIPASFAELTDQHFPLFCTFQKICSMLEIALTTAARPCGTDSQHTASVHRPGHDEWMEYGRSRATSTNTRLSGEGAFTTYDRDVWSQPGLAAACFEKDGDESKGGKEVNFDRFQSVYWPHFDEGLKSHFEPQLVWAEIQSLIKGSEEACRIRRVEDSRGFISLEAYKKLSERRYPSFSHSREKLYKLFENYERLKARHKDYDEMDRIYKLFLIRHKLGAAAPSLRLIDEMYVDEVQDLAPSMMRMLLKLLKHPGGFMMLCGDTAQTIAKGSLFRFEDLTSMVFRELSDIDPVGAKLDEARLVHNYRSHNGILRLAASVIDLLYYYFPESIDKMERDRSDEEGCLPIVWNISAFSEWQESAEAGWTALFAGEGGRATIEFGAEQAILVRTEDAKARMMKLKERPGFVGTVFDAKGLEFRDVLLFNFFKDSPAKNEWRVLLERVRARGKSTSDFPQFDRIKMNILASELKELYTAVTRPQQRLWIVDEEMFVGEKHPMLQYWEVGGCSDEFTLVNCAEEFGAASSFASFGHRSTQEEWARQGRYLFHNGHYSQAEHCFNRAGESCRRQQEISHAFMLRDEGIKFRNREEKEESKTKFKEAATCFKDLGFVEHAANCYDQAECNKDAGDLLREHGFFEKAAEQYLKCNVTSEHYAKRDALLDASDCLQSAGNWTGALRILQTGKLWVEAISLIKEQSSQIDSACRIAVAKLAFLFFEEKKDFRDQADDALRLFATDKEREVFLVTHKCYDRLIGLYITTNQFEKAAKVLEKQWRWLDASRYFLKASSPKSSADNAIRAISCPTRWRRDTLKCYQFSPQDDLCQSDAVSLLDTIISDCDTAKEGLDSAFKCKMLKGMILGDSSLLTQCASYFQSRLEKADPRKDAEKTAELAAWEMRSIDALFSSRAAEGLDLANRSSIILRFASTFHNMMTAIPYNDKKTGFWYAMQRACEKFFSVIPPMQGQTTQSSDFEVIHDIWGAYLLEVFPLKYLTTDTWTPKVFQSDMSCPFVKSVSIAEGRRGMSRYLLNTACKVLVDHLESGATFDRLRSMMPCPAFNTHGDCRDRRGCVFMHERATAKHQKPYLDLLAQQCIVLQVLLEIKRLQDKAENDKFHDSVRSKLMPLKRRWLEKLVRALQPISLYLESHSAVCEYIHTMPDSIWFGLADQIRDAWLPPDCKAADVGAFLRSTMLLIKISSTSRSYPFHLIRNPCDKLALSASGTSSSHFTLYKEGDKNRIVHYRCLMFWSFLESGDVCRALEAGVAYMQFTLKHLRDANVGPSLNPNPVDLIDFLELLSALAMTANKMFNDLVVPTSYMNNIFRRRELCMELAFGFKTYTESLRFLPLLEKQVFNFLKALVDGKIFAAMKPEEQKRQKSFDDWRALCVRGSMLLIFLSVNQTRELDSIDSKKGILAMQQALDSTVGKIRSLATLSVDKFRFPRDDKEAFLGRSGAGLLQRVESWFAQSVDGLIRVMREDMCQHHHWCPTVSEPVVLLKSRTFLFSKRQNWMDLQWMDAGAVEWKCQKAEIERPEIAVTSVKDIEPDRSASDGLQTITKKLDAELKAANTIRTRYLRLVKSKQFKAVQPSGATALQHFIERAEPILKEWSNWSGGVDMEWKRKVFKYRIRYRTDVPKVYVGLQAMCHKVEQASEALRPYRNSEQVLELYECCSELARDAQDLLDALELRDVDESHSGWDCDRLAELLGKAEKLAGVMRCKAAEVAQMVGLPNKADKTAKRGR